MPPQRCTSKTGSTRRTHAFRGRATPPRPAMRLSVGVQGIAFADTAPHRVKTVWQGFYFFVTCTCANSFSKIADATQGRTSAQQNNSRLGWAKRRSPIFSYPEFVLETSLLDVTIKKIWRWGNKSISSLPTTTACHRLCTWNASREGDDARGSRCVRSCLVIQTHKRAAPSLIF